MLVRLMYASRAKVEITHDELMDILKKSKANNPANGITGVLCISGEVFLQVLEGGRSSVSGLYGRIIQDARHRDVELLSLEEISERTFASWSMGQVNLQRVNQALLLKYSDTAELNPFSMPASASMALLKELMATAQIIGPS